MKGLKIRQDCLGFAGLVLPRIVV